MERGFERFIARDTGDYRAALVLLAINIGHPEIAGHVLRAVRTSPQKEWSAFARAVEKKAHANLHEQETLRQIQNRLEKTVDALHQLEIPIEFPENLEPYRLWAPEVGRYSFHWHLSEEPQWQ
jgi:hypothetical protein